MATQLWLLRHGEAEPHQADDAARRLTPRGAEQSRAAGRALAAMDVAFQLVLSSPRVRARDTAVLACEALGNDVVEHAPLGGDFDAGQALEIMAGHLDERVLLVGHEPDISQIARDLTGARLDMKKGGVLGIRLQGALRPSAPAQARGELVALLRPRELERIHD